MKRNEFIAILDREQEIIKALFTRKSGSYGAEDEVFYNFKETARRVFGSTKHEDMWKTIHVYMDKHMVALTKGIGEPEFCERLRDIIVYSLLGIGLWEEYEIEENLKWEIQEKVNEK